MTASSTPRASVLDALLASPQRFTFFQAVHLLQQMHPDRPAVGFDGPARHETVRFRPVLDLSHQSTDLRALRRIGDGRYEVSVGFLSLYGPGSPLPTSYTEDLLEEQSHVDAGEVGFTREFLDIFNHRLQSLLFRALSKYRYLAQFRDAGGRDPMTRRLQALSGLPDSDGGGERRIASTSLLRFAGLLMTRPASAGMLRTALASRFSEFEVALEPCVLRRVAVPVEALARLGRPTATFGHAVLGETVADRANTFRISVGPVDRATFLAFLPGGRLVDELGELVALWNHDGLDYEVVVELGADEPCPSVGLGDRSLHLGWSSWLGDEVAAEDRRVTFFFGAECEQTRRGPADEAAVHG